MLRVENLSTFYDNIQALKDISLQVKEGEIVTLIGANGAGKTTSLLTISGLLRPATGEIYFRGKKINNVPPHDIVKMGISHVPEGRRIFPRLTLKENLYIGAYTRKDKNGLYKDMEMVFDTFPQLRGRKNRRQEP